jgi:hypothetical protein
MVRHLEVTGGLGSRQQEIDAGTEEPDAISADVP